MSNNNNNNNSNNLSVNQNNNNNSNSENTETSSHLDVLISGSNDAIVNSKKSNAKTISDLIFDRFSSLSPGNNNNNNSNNSCSNSNQSHNNSNNNNTVHNSSSRRKLLKQYNHDLEKHIKQHQNDNEFCRQDSFLKKFSTRSQANTNNNPTQLEAFQSNNSALNNSEIYINSNDCLNRTQTGRNSRHSYKFSFSKPESSNQQENDHQDNATEENRLIDDGNPTQLLSDDKNLNQTNNEASPLNTTNPNDNQNESNSNVKIPKNKKKNSNTKLLNKGTNKGYLLGTKHTKTSSKSSATSETAQADTSATNKLPQSATSSQESLDNDQSASSNSKSFFKIYYNKLVFKCNYFVLSPDDNCMFVWLIILNSCVLYNMWLVIARQSFENLQILFQFYWRIADGISDSIYLIDVLVQFRTGYLEQGLLVYNSKKLALNYVKSRKFLLDMFSLAPFELFQLKYGYAVPILRFPKFFKIYRLIELYYITESRTLYPNVWRVTNLTHILFLLGHWFAGFYFLISKAEGFKGHWSYPEPVDEFALLPRMYLRCLYWSTLTLTTIGDLPPPETNWQWLKEMSNSRYLFSIAVHYLAVFVIALIVGQVGNVITNRNANRVEFERLLDGAKQFMRNHNVPTEMQKRVQRWYDYSWSRGRMNGAGDIHSIGLLPDKLKTELALHVNLETLRKVSIFQECQPEFLHDLVLKMRAYIFTPGDMICRKGEIAREMFIIADGVLEVIGENGNVLTKMYSGDFFGEIGILNIEGASNRRTADVRSVGYAELFSLSKEDVLSAVKDYPEAERILIEYGKRRLNQNIAKNAAAAAAVAASSSSTSSSKINIKITNETGSTKDGEEKPAIVDIEKQSKEKKMLAESSQLFQELNRKLRDRVQYEHDVELGINLISEENRGLTTDMLGLPASKTSEVLLGNLSNSELNKISQKEELLEAYLNSKSKCFNNKIILETIDEILKKCGDKKNRDTNADLIENMVLKLKEEFLRTKDRKIEYLEDLLIQKDAKIKLLDSRIKILQKYMTQKKTENAV